MNKTTPLGARLRALRRERGITQAEVAAAIGIERPSVTMIETGRDAPGRATLFALATYFGVSADYLETGTHVPLPDNPVGELVNDRAELAWLRLWRAMDDGERNTLLRRLSAGLDLDDGAGPFRRRRPQCDG